MNHGRLWCNPVGGPHSYLDELNMKITQEDKDAVIAILAANPKATTQPMSYSDVLTKSGLTRFKLNLIKKELSNEGKIREDLRIGQKLKIYLMIADKRQQIIGLIKEDQTGHTYTLQRYTGLDKHEVNQICLQLVFDGLVDVQNIQVRPSEKLLDSVSLVTEQPVAAT